MRAGERSESRCGRRRAGRLVWIAVAAGWMAVAWGAPAARGAVGAPRPRLVVEQSEADLGVIEPGPRVEFVFRLKNAGDMPLQIADARPTCGCVVAAYDREIAPGGTGTVSAHLDTAGRHGMQVKHLMLYSNDPQASMLPLTLKVTLRHAVEALPDGDLPFPTQRGQGQERVVTLHSFEPEPLQVLKVETSAPYVKAEALPETEVPDEHGQGSRWRRQVRITVLPDGPAEAFDATVTVHTNSPKRPLIVLNIAGTPEGAVMAVPPRLYFGDVPATLREPIARSVILMTHTDPFKLLRVECSDPALRFQVLQPDQAAQFCEVVVRYAGGWKPGLVKGKLILHTSDRMRPRVEVPFEAEAGH